MHYIGMTLILCMLGLTSCASSPPSHKCDCEQVKTQLYEYAEDYAMCLEDNGNLRALIRRGE